MASLARKVIILFHAFKWSHFLVGAARTFNLNNTKTYDSELIVKKNKFAFFHLIKIQKFFKVLFKIPAQFQSECSLTGKTVFQDDNQNALIIRKKGMN